MLEITRQVAECSNCGEDRVGNTFEETQASHPSIYLHICRTCWAAIRNPFTRKYEGYSDKMLEGLKAATDVLWEKQDIAMELIWRKKDRRKNTQKED